jgi:hypothetical protein
VGGSRQPNFQVTPQLTSGSVAQEGIDRRTMKLWIGSLPGSAGQDLTPMLHPYCGQHMAADKEMDTKMNQERNQEMAKEMAKLSGKQRGAVV